MANPYYLPSQPVNVTPLSQAISGIPDQMRQRQQENLLREAGGVAASGDYMGAGNILMGGGMLGAGAKMHQQARSIDTADRETIDKIMQSVSKAWAYAKTPEQKRLLMEHANRLYPSQTGEPFLDDNDTPLLDTLAQQHLAQSAPKPLSKIGKEEYDAERNPALRPILDAQRNKPSGDDVMLNRIQLRDDLKTLGGYRKDANAARGLLGRIKNVKNLRKQYNFEGPFWGPVATAAGFGASLKSAATEMQLDFTERTKGAISDKEMGLFGQATPGPNMRDEEANKVLAAMEAGALRVRERQKFFLEWRAKHKTLVGADDAWDMYVDENRVIDVDKNGQMAVNKKNIRNWRKYVTDGRFSLVPDPTKQGAAPQQPRIFNSIPPRDQLQPGDVVNRQDGSTIMWNGVGFDEVQ